jgi:2C-methyl-D-erythritol 2,4-cyclodiphosphate synthase
MEVVARLTPHCFTPKEISPLPIKQEAKLGPVRSEIFSSIANFLLLETRLIVSSQRKLASAHHYGNEKDQVPLFAIRYTTASQFTLYHCGLHFTY